MHAPNMFFSAIVSSFHSFILLAGYGWEKFEKDDLGVLSGLILIFLAFVSAMGTKGASYTYVTLLFRINGNFTIILFGIAFIN